MKLPEGGQGEALDGIKPAFGGVGVGSRTDLTVRS
jgi:hypothetical protein